MEVDLQEEDECAYKQVAGWATDDVVRWMNGLHRCLEPHIPQFLAHCICGSDLLKLSHQQLEYLKVTQVGHQELLLEAVDLLSALEKARTHDFTFTLASNLSKKTSQLINALNPPSASARKKRMSSEDHEASTALTRVETTAAVMMSAKLLLSWLDRNPSSLLEDYDVFRTEVLRSALDLAGILMDTYDTSEMMETCRSILKCTAVMMRPQSLSAVEPIRLLTVQLQPSEESGLGFSIQRTRQGNLVVNNVIPGSPASKSSTITLGVEIVQINNQNVVGWEISKVVETLKASGHEVSLVINVGSSSASNPPPLESHTPPLESHTPPSEDLPNGDQVDTGADNSSGFIPRDTPLNDSPAFTPRDIPLNDSPAFTPRDTPLNDSPAFTPRDIPLNDSPAFTPRDTPLNDSPAFIPRDIPLNDSRLLARHNTDPCFTGSSQSTNFSDGMSSSQDTLDDIAESPVSFEGDTDFSGMEKILKKSKVLDLHRTSSAPLTHRERCVVMETSTESGSSSGGRCGEGKGLIGSGETASLDCLDGASGESGSITGSENQSYESRLQTRTSSDSTAEKTKKKAKSAKPSNLPPVAYRTQVIGGVVVRVPIKPEEQEKPTQKRQRNSRHRNRNKKVSGSGGKPPPVVEERGGGGGGTEDSSSEGGGARKDAVMSPGSGSDVGLVTSPVTEELQSPTGKGGNTLGWVGPGGMQSCGSDVG